MLKNKNLISNTHRQDLNHDDLDEPSNWDRADVKPPPKSDFFYTVLNYSTVWIIRNLH